jgi:hypothetical protein
MAPRAKWENTRYAHYDHGRDSERVDLRVAFAARSDVCTRPVKGEARVHDQIYCPTPTGFTVGVVVEIEDEDLFAESESFLYHFELVETFWICMQRLRRMKHRIYRRRC